MAFALVEVAVPLSFGHPIQTSVPRGIFLSWRVEDDYQHAAHLLYMVDQDDQKYTTAEVLVVQGAFGAPAIPKDFMFAGQAQKLVWYPAKMLEMKVGYESHNLLTIPQGAKLLDVQTFLLFIKVKNDTEEV